MDLITPPEIVKARLAQQTYTKHYAMLCDLVEKKTFLQEIAGKSSNERKYNSVIRSKLLVAVGLSVKAGKNIGSTDFENEMIDLLLAGRSDEELADLYMHGLGQASFGRMSNIIGKEGEDDVVKGFVAYLERNELLHCLKYTRGRETPTIISWSNSTGHRTVFRNKKIPFSPKNSPIDTLVANGHLKKLPRSPGDYMAFGETKAGIDPAGSDEHYKTANTHFERIHSLYGVQGVSCPPLFFVGAMITQTVEESLNGDLQSGSLARAANLTNAGQMESFYRWLAEI